MSSFIVSIILDLLLLSIYITLTILCYSGKFRRGMETYLLIAQIYFPLEFLIHFIFFIFNMINRYNSKNKKCIVITRLVFWIISMPTPSCTVLDSPILTVLIILSLFNQIFLIGITQVVIDSMNNNRSNIIIIKNATLPNDSSAPLPSNALFTPTVDSINKLTD